MARKRGGISGKIGDVSGRIGDVSGRMGDVSGRMGDVSGIEGKMGDVSGESSLLDVKDFMLQDRETDRISCLERRVRRLENEILGIASWLDVRLRVLEHGTSEVDDTLTDHEKRISDLEAGPEEPSEPNEPAPPARTRRP